MKYFELDKEEKQTITDYKQKKLKTVAGFKHNQKQYREYAQAAMDKTKNINIRISESDLLKIKSLAVKKGVPYQTMITSLIHQYSSGQIKE